MRKIILAVLMFCAATCLPKTSSAQNSGLVTVFVSPNSGPTGTQFQIRLTSNYPLLGNGNCIIRDPQGAEVLQEEVKGAGSVVEYRPSEVGRFDISCLFEGYVYDPDADTYIYESINASGGFTVTP
jgi:hypothetical protein